MKSYKMSANSAIKVSWWGGERNLFFSWFHAIYDILYYDTTISEHYWNCCSLKNLSLCNTLSALSHFHAFPMEMQITQWIKFKVHFKMPPVNPHNRRNKRQHSAYISDSPNTLMYIHTRMNTYVEMPKEQARRTANRALIQSNVAYSFN